MSGHLHVWSRDVYPSFAFRMVLTLSLDTCTGQLRKMDALAHDLISGQECLFVLAGDAAGYLVHDGQISILGTALQELLDMYGFDVQLRSSLARLWFLHAGLVAYLVWKCS